MAANRMETVSKLLGLEVPMKFSRADKRDYNDRTYGESVVGEGRFIDFMRWVEKKPQATSGVGNNANEFNKQVFSDAELHFKGGSFQELIMPHTNFEVYRDANKTLSQGKIWRQAVQSFSEINLRRRSRCQYDGDFDFDKRWDIEPFQRRSPRKLSHRIINVVVKFAFNCGVSAESVSRFGAFAAAVVNLLEMNGVMVNLDISSMGTNYAYGSSGSVYEVILNVKKPDEYLPPGQILKSLSSVFFRRSIFGMIVLSAEMLNKPVAEGLGIPMHHNKVFESTKDTLTIYSTPSQDDQDKIIQDLVKMLGVDSEPESKAKAEKLTKIVIPKAEPWQEIEWGKF